MIFPISPKELLLVALILVIILSIAAIFLRQKSASLSRIIDPLRILVVPFGSLLFYLTSHLGLPATNVWVRVLSTTCWLGFLWAFLSTFELLFFSDRGLTNWKTKVPGLFVDLLRFSVIFAGTSLIIVLVWDGNLSSALATLGVGSLVLGLALQDTLGNLMAGIALLFERPFQVGDWIRVGDIIGKVLEMNWRAVRLQSRSLDMVVVPNSVLGKEKIHNFSRPTSVHGIESLVGFSFTDPPNKVKRILIDCLATTQGVLQTGITARTNSFAESAIMYQMRYFIDNYESLPDIEESIKTRIWYAAQRNHLTIPFPIRTVYKTEIPPAAPKDSRKLVLEILQGTSIFGVFEPEELSILVDDSLIEDYAADETIVRKGEIGDAMYVIIDGAVKIVSGTGPSQSFPNLKKGDFFGEMAAFTGEPRSVSVAAITDTKLLAIHKDVLSQLIALRPSLAEDLSKIIEMRKLGLSELSQLEALPPQELSKAQAGTREILASIKRFFGVVR